MYCNQCGYELENTADYCENCGAVVEVETKETSELKRRFVGFVYKKRIAIIIILLAIIAAAGAAIAFFVMGSGQLKADKLAPPASSAVFVDIAEEYEMEDDELILDPLMAVYSDGTMGDVTDYKVQIDSMEYEIKDGKIDGKELYDGIHLLSLEWTIDKNEFSYEKSVSIIHKLDTWAKYPDLVGRTGKEIVSAYGPLSAPRFGAVTSGDLGYAYVTLPKRNLQLTFPAALIGNPVDYGESDAECIEMSGSLGELFHNIDPEMTLEDLVDEMEITLSPSDSGGCSGVLASGNQIYIGVGEVTDGIYTPDTKVTVTASEDRKRGIIRSFVEMVNEVVIDFED